MTEQSKTNQMAVPEAKAAMNRFKEEVASELGVPLKEGYNGDLTSAQAGSIGGEMVKKMIMKQEQQMSGKIKKKRMAPCIPEAVYEGLFFYYFSCI